MRFDFRTKKLRNLYVSDSGAKGYPQQVVDAFFRVMAIIEAATDERDLYAHKSLHLEKLEGARGRRGERSARLNQQYRLFLTFDTDAAGRRCLIIAIDRKHYKE